MARKLPTLLNWFAVPGHAHNLELFLESPTGKLWLATIQHEFRADPGAVVVVPGVSYVEVHGLRNSFREGCQKMLDTTQLMSVAKEQKPHLPDKGWATEPLRRESEKEEPRKSASRKKK